MPQSPAEPFTAPLPARSLGLTGATNFRDLGGYVGHEGRTIRWRRLFRSDHLGALTPTDAATLRDLGVRRVCDFRGVTERETAVCAIEDAEVHFLPIEPTVVQRLSDVLGSGRQPEPGETVEMMRETYRNFVLDNTPRFAELFGHLLASDAPLVFHCTAGKDRTGFAAALLLLALDVPHDVVLADYLLTNDHLKPGRGSTSLPPDVAAILYKVQEPFLGAALAAVQEHHGGVEAYLRAGLGLNDAARERLRSLYLEPAGGRR